MSGAAHADIGAYLLVLWGIPANIVSIVGYHHRPSELDDKCSDAIVAVHIAQSLLDIIFEDTKPPSMDWSYLTQRSLTAHMPEWLKFALERTKMSSSQNLQGLLGTFDEKAWNPK